MPTLRWGALALALFSPALVSAVPSYVDSGMPPVRFRADNAAVVIFTGRQGIDQMCGVAGPNYIVLACTHSINGTPVVTMPNPCGYGDTEAFAKIMCHEMGHVNGWPADHGD